MASRGHMTLLGCQTRFASVWDCDVGIRLQVLLCLLRLDQPLELVAINLFPLHKNLGALMEDSNVALHQVLCPPTTSQSISLQESKENKLSSVGENIDSQCTNVREHTTDAENQFDGGRLQSLI